LNVLKKNIKILLIIFLVLKSNVLFSQMTEAELRAHWVFIISENVTWTGKEDIEKFRIGILGTAPTELEPLQNLAPSKQINDKSIEIVHFTKLRNVTLTEILFVEEKENDNIDLIYNKIKGTGTLLITYKCETSEFIMINLLLAGIKKQFEINSSNLSIESISVQDKLMALGGSKVDLQGLFDKKEAELVEKEKELIEKETLLNQKQTELEVQVAENIKQKQENELQKQKNTEQTVALEQKEEEINVQKAKAAELMKAITNQEIILRQSQLKLTEKESELIVKQEELEEKNSILETQKNELDIKNDELVKKTDELEEREKKISEQSSQIETQKLIIFGVISFLVLLLGLGFVIWRGYVINRRINAELNKKNVEVNKQKEEIEAQSYQLEQVNKELEKLSIVASKTQNAIIIMDPEGNFEWVNIGFTRLYGYTLQLLINELDENIVNVSTHPEIKEIIKRCSVNKETVIYESVNVARSGEKFWVQTTLTPILDSEYQVTKIVAIDAEINKLKQQEREIRQQSEELRQQKDELMEQKEQIELKNKLINSSIKYAQTIQKSILPIENNINKFFNTFIIFKPKDVVSGDFYWYFQSEINEFFFAAVDCTGHGVPGAFMSLISSRILSSIVIEKQVTDPMLILKQLNNDIIRVLKQDETDNNDGMDLCFIKVVKVNEKYKIFFAGAKRPLFYYQKCNDEINMLKGDRKSIGGVRLKRRQVEFTNQEIILEKDDIMYLSTDGMMDQNSSDRKRFGTSRFVEILNKIKHEPIIRQKELLEQSLDNYQRGEEQRDDITILGVQLR
jgi:PAS domain S-box-containing protein